jgi:hypothetical protein
VKTYIVTRKSDGQKVYEYSHTEPVEWQGMEFATHTHAEKVEVIDPTPGAPGWVVLDVIDYLKLLQPAERIAIRQAAETDPVVEDIVDLQRNTLRIRSDDPDLLNALDYLTGIGILAAGRKQEILRG